MYTATFWAENEETKQIEAISSVDINTINEDYALQSAREISSQLKANTHILIELTGNIAEL